mmetsp:Transcript_29841/g.33294  ORF Transcript_29841/g.33294 Transcript_29841/m.33294 type:complete len:274 (-) Transcript_29841:515-1336(-)
MPAKKNPESSAHLRKASLFQKFRPVVIGDTVVGSGPRSASPPHILSKRASLNKTSSTTSLPGPPRPTLGRTCTPERPVGGHGHGQSSLNIPGDDRPNREPFRSIALPQPPGGIEVKYAQEESISVNEVTTDPTISAKSSTDNAGITPASPSKTASFSQNTNGDAGGAQGNKKPRSLFKSFKKSLDHVRLRSDKSDKSSEKSMASIGSTERAPRNHDQRSQSTGSCERKGYLRLSVRDGFPKFVLGAMKSRFFVLDSKNAQLMYYNTFFRILAC